MAASSPAMTGWIVEKKRNGRRDVLAETFYRVQLAAESRRASGMFVFAQLRIFRNCLRMIT